jgi:small GTP-binding protein
MTRSARKLVFLGDSAVGKTTIASRLGNSLCDPEFIATISVGYNAREVVLQGHHVVFDIWDTAGQEKYRSLVPRYIRDVNAAWIVFDVTDLPSFANVRGWIAMIREANDHPYIMLFGNKTDLADRVVSSTDAEALADEEGLSYAEGSGISGVGIENAFNTTAAACLGSTVEMTPITAPPSSNSGSSCC